MVVSRVAVLVAASVTVCVAVLAGTGHAIEVRHVGGARFSADLTRAYVPCLAPNTLTSTGIPACTPAVTSACNYTTGALDMRKREDTKEIDVDVDLNNVTGPGSCTTGPYTLNLGLRISLDDAACTSGECTLTDVHVAIPLVLIGNDFELNNFTLESALPGLPPAIANYEILDAVIMAPDGKPIAGAGTSDDGGADVSIDMSVAYQACLAPDTANAWAAPACSAPVWESPCDFAVMDVEFNRTSAGPRIRPLALGLTGAPATCANGTYAFVPRVRITTDDCGPLCTLIDLDVPLLVTAVNGEIPRITVPLITDPLPVGIGFLTDDDNLELLGLVVYDSASNLLAGSAVTPTLRIDRPRVTAAYKDTADPTDDVLRIKGEFPHPVIDPTVGGATFTITGKAGPAYTVTIPGGSWVAKRPGQWIYRDDLGTIAGVQRIEIRQFNRSGVPAGFKVDLVAREIDAGATNIEALNLVVTISDGGAGTAVATHGTICKKSTNRLSCK